MKALWAIFSDKDLVTTSSTAFGVNPMEDGHRRLAFDQNPVRQPVNHHAFPKVTFRQHESTGLQSEPGWTMAASNVRGQHAFSV